LPLFENEQHFLLSLIDCLKRRAQGESLSDDQKYLIRFDKPFERSKAGQENLSNEDSEDTVNLEQI